jgi:asparagine synthase (glutamine-hydrolysing)
MLASIRHRGPDQFGVYLDATVALGSARLSIIDLDTGQQPLSNEDGSLWIVFNGEVFNHVELRPWLEQRGHRFATHTDTEVILHLYEELGSRCLERLNGQFSLAIWDVSRRSLFLARDRLGVRPLFYTQQGGVLYFASEIKALLNGGDFGVSFDPVALRQVFTFWAPLAGRSAFRGVGELPAGHSLVANDQGVVVCCYWRPDFSVTQPPPVTPAECLEEFEALLSDATRIRLRADVPVGAYLSGGLDSSVIAALVRQHAPARLRTFSIAFTDAQFDERAHQERMAQFLGTEHSVVEATHADIGRVFPEVVWHAEVPLLRTAPAPMFLLSELVRKSGFKVVLTGEGADEFLAGYDIFKEAKVRRFWACRPDSRWRARLLSRLYPDVLASANAAFVAAFFGDGLAEVDAPDYSHAIRWRNTRRIWRFLTDAMLEGTDTLSAARETAPLLSPQFHTWEPLARAQYLEVVTFLSTYLLSSQGDRVAMAHSVEGRFPFLDPRVVEFCSHLPTSFKMPALRDKHLLRLVARKHLPRETADRRKHPYRAPIHRSFFHASTPDYVHEALSPAAIERAGVFKSSAVSRLASRLAAHKPVGETDDMALAGILSTQLLFQQFVEHFRRAAPLGPEVDIKVCRQCKRTPSLP